MDNLRGLREKAAAVGIVGVQTMDRYEILARLAEVDSQVEALRQECAKLGLATTGTRQDLEMRLTEHASGVSARDRRLYQATACLLLGLAVAGLAISTPHITSALARLMGVSVWMAALLAVVIDGGIVALKMMDNLSSKFNLGSARVTGKMLLVVCLTFSAALNASEFLTHASGLFAQTLAVSGAVFISTFVFGTSYFGSNMMLKCEPKTHETEKLTSAAVLIKAAAEVERLERLAQSAK